jgi:hypothetical protein
MDIMEAIQNIEKAFDNRIVRVEFYCDFSGMVVTSHWENREVFFEFDNLQEFISEIEKRLNA